MTDLTTPRTIKAVKGRLSFHELNAGAAHAEALAGPYASVAQGAGVSKPYANILITQPQFDRITKFIEETFFPFCNSQFNKGRDEKYALEPKFTKALLEQVKDGDGPYNTPFKLPTEKTLDLYPEAARSMKLMGYAGVDIAGMAAIKDGTELKIPDPDVMSAVILPIEQTVHTFYNGCTVLAQVGLYTYLNGKNPGFSASTNELIFGSATPRFGGAADLDQDEIFLALDED
jgi:hypothetical protein